MTGSALPMRQVSYKLQSLERALDTPPLKTGEAAFCGTDHSIRFENIRFSYRDTEVIKGISFTVPQGTTTALIGHSGSGKSTLAKLLVHDYDLSSGRILIGGQNICDMTQDALQAQIAYVSQDSFLFNKSIMENIRIGRKNASDAQVIAAAQLAECDDFIRALPQGYDTQAGLAGSMLSGGQKQRIAFARAILKDAPVIVLDEATAFVDAENEQKMRRAIAGITKDKTVIMIAHKLRAVLQPIRHDFTREEAMHYAQTINTFFAKGWKWLCGME